ncbi:MAG: 50S ribosomal protein L4 [Candidatus Yonathbacteria bacterium CG_4_10_14_3_um_filter_47_65]|uniref:Large ribosomal subunit protein uL4 n=2 Tax=Parcubacteria group TaxID=1794811 RepID=A0A2M8D5I2_9BACT|nr:MAG: 50S ribosomal protein L4 [Candidatus Nomurabacteria bacterium CG1_02_47_685]PIP04082.1 MAG: 50S ribosomal protein L4 [Candidatus Yonathbacteria bacterium CG23_combo_of_CG06-09_8_20_14_all_46_18]PIQ30935.1 MAG: 50S ribosomal protein L4 [Candidatus Yonathbacteria bacterium CG17_big_fil_post_rev_8_21_14_2_50_46_19]PIX56551.1 MAG: 50S ribosomal protein L4 [Candidatus Yonathbacteria bacterium CG_4_10_14_3_um_filter_47_65]PIY57282.1 MAG: 50S ribosomal protein L4 [Candidatus Yonathbacteria bac
MEATIYNVNGKKKGSILLPEHVFGLPWNGDLVHQVVVSMQSNARMSIAHTKDRSDVSGTGKKPWQQKGTGRARHGSRRSPIWVGGGVAHGPTNEKNFYKKINKKAKAKALSVVLSEKMRNSEILFIDTVDTGEIKARKAKEMLVAMGSIPGFEKISGKKTNAAYIALSGKNAVTEKSFGNFGNVGVGSVANINPLILLKYKYLIISDPEESVGVIEKRLSRTETVA